MSYVLCQAYTCHYHPARVGDHLNGETTSHLQSLGDQQKGAGAVDWGTAYAFEMRTLVPAVSYLADLRIMATEIATDLAAALRGGLVPTELRDVPQGVADLATQALAVEQHLTERVDVLRAAARRICVCE